MSTWTPTQPATTASKANREKFTVGGAAFYAFTMTDNTGQYANGKYTLVIGNLSEKAVAKLEEEGVNVKNKDIFGHFITVKLNNPIKAYDVDGQEIPSGNIGNGSRVEARLTTYTWNTPSGTPGVSPSLIHLKVTELNAYQAHEADGEVF